MGITVADIEQKEFAFKGNGYDPYDVDQYLDQICDEMVAMQDKIDQLTAELAQAKEQAEHAATVAETAVQPMPQQVVRAEADTAKAAGTLESILLSAQRISDEAVEKAKEQAAQIVQEAQDKASGILDEAQSEKKALEGSLDSVKQALSNYKERFLGLLNEQKALLDAEDGLFDK